MIKNEHLISRIESAIIQGLDTFEAQFAENTLSDVYLYFDEENTIMVVFDDMENRLSEVELDDFSKSFDKNREEEFISSIKVAVENVSKGGYFQRDYVYKPFSVSLVDNDFIVSEELLFIDDDTLKLNDGLLADLNKDLDSFLKKLLE